MLATLDRVSNRTAYLIASAALAVSVAAALLTPQDQQLGAWVRLVVWHGMLTGAAAMAILLMGGLAVASLVTERESLYEWARALQVLMLPVWVLAVAIGATAARLIWLSFDLGERRMVMSIGYTVVAAVALIVSLAWEDRRLRAGGQMVTALAMAVGLAWIVFGPSAGDVHPAGAILSSTDPAFKVAALTILASLLTAVLALAVPVRRWLARPRA